MQITVIEYLTALGLYFVTIESYDQNGNWSQIEAYMNEGQLKDNENTVLNSWGNL